MAKKKTKRGRGHPPRNPGGRPCKLTPAVQRDMCAYLAEGNYLETACAMVGVSKAAVMTWLKNGHKAADRWDRGYELDEKEKKYKRFTAAIKKAEAQAEAAALKELRLMAGEAWQSIAWRLERRHPSRWGRRQAIEHSTPAGKPVQVQKIVIGDREIEF